MNNNGAIMAAINRISKLTFMVSDTKKATTKNNMNEIDERRPLVTNAVFPTSWSLAICLDVQKLIIAS